MTVRALLDAFGDWRESGAPLVLASVYETEGSTYSKAGARMLVTADGRFRGMLSGGCLEGDLAERARDVATRRRPAAITYDLGGDDAELWGLGVGCDGLMRVFLQPLLPERDYQPFAAMAEVLRGERRGGAATILQADDEALVSGATLVRGEAGTQAFDVPDDMRSALLAGLDQAIEEGGSSARSMDLGGRRAQILFGCLSPPPRLLVLGGGLDAEPLVRMAAELGWRVSVQDHRAAYIDKGDFRSADDVSCRPAEELGERLRARRYDAVIVMSHHLASDRRYLSQLAGSDIAYIGLLGPPHRRRRLLEDLGAGAGNLASRLHGPAGLDIGADGPASIALSILAEMHGVLAASGHPAGLSAPIPG